MGMCFTKQTNEDSLNSTKGGFCAYSDFRTWPLAVTCIEITSTQGAGAPTAKPVATQFATFTGVLVEAGQPANCAQRREDVFEVLFFKKGCRPPRGGLLSPSEAVVANGWKRAMSVEQP